jgi:hypothetical protein
MIDVIFQLARGSKAARQLRFTQRLQTRESVPSRRYTRDFDSETKIVIEVRHFP